MIFRIETLRAFIPSAQQTSLQSFKKSILFVLLVLVATAGAATRTWSGNGGDNNWTTAGNWDVLPVATDALVFPNGALQQSNNNDFPALTSFAGITISGGGYTLSGNSVTLTSSLTATHTSGSSTVALLIAGAAAPGVVVNAVGGTLILSGANTYSGTTNVLAGTLQAGSAASPLGTVAGATVVSSGATLDLNGFNLANAEPVTLNGTGVSSAGALTNSSSTATTFAGLITLGSASTIVANNGNIVLSAAGTITGSGFGLTLDGSNTGSSLASIIGIVAGSVTKKGSGTWTLSGANTFTGGVTIQAGTLIGTTSANVFGTAGSITVGHTSGSDNASLLVGSAITIARPIVLATGTTGTLTVGNTGTAISPAFSGGVTGTNNLTINSNATSGTITFSTASVNNAGTITNIGAGTGTTSITGGIGSNVTGVIQNSVNTALTVSTTALTVNGSGTTLTNTAGARVLTISGGVIGTGNLVLNNNSDLVGGISLSTNVNPIGSITNSGSGTGTVLLNDVGASVTGVTQNSSTSFLTLAGTNTSYNGTTTLSVGTLRLGSATALGGNGNASGTGGPLVISAGTTLDASANTALTTVNAQTWNGNFTYGGSFTLNTGTGAISIVPGTFQLTNTGSVAPTFGGTVTGTTNLTLKAEAAGGIGFAGVVNVTGTITNSGAGTGVATLSGGIGSNVTTVTLNSLTSAMTVSGVVTVNGSGSTFINANTLTPVILTLSGGTNGTGSLILKNNTSLANGITVSTGTVNHTGSIVNNGTGDGSTLFSAPVGVNVTGITQNSSTSALTLSGANTAYAGTTTLTSGILRLGSATALGGNGSPTGTGGSLIINGGVLDASATTTITTINAQTWNGDFTFGGGFALNLGTGAVSIVPSNLQLSTNSGTTVLTTVGGVVTGTSNLTLKMNGTVGVTFAGLFNITGSVVNSGTAGGTATFSGGIGSNVTGITENSLTSPVTVSGNLAVNASGTTIINSNIAGASVVTVSGGVSGTGNLTLRNNSDIAAGITVSGITVNHTGLIINSGTGAGAVTFSAAVGSNVTGITHNSATSALNVSGFMTVNASGTTLTNGIAGGGTVLTVSGGLTGTGNLVLNNNSDIVNGITLSGSSVNHAGSITNSGSGTGNSLVSAAIGANVTSITQNSATSPLALTGTNTPFAGPTNLTAGALRLGSATALGGNNSPTGTGGALIIAAGTTLDATVATTITTTNAKTVNGNFSFGGAFALNLGPGVMTVVPGTLQVSNVGAASATFPGAISSTTNLTLKADAAGGLVFSGLVNTIGTISNAGAGAGTVTFSGGVGTNVTNITQNSATSPLTVSGALAIHSPSTIIANAVSGVAAILTVSGGVTGSGNLILNNNSDQPNGITASTVALNNTGTITSSGTGLGTVLISGGVGANVTGVTQTSETSALNVSGVLNLNASGTTVTNSVGGFVVLTLSGGTTGTGNLILRNNSDVTSGITVSGSAVNHIGTLTNSGTGAGSTVITAAVGLNVSGITQNSSTSFLTLSGTNTPYNGTTSLTAGTLRLGSATALGGNGSITGTGGALIVAAGTTLDASAATTLTTTNAKTLNGNFVVGGSFALNLGPGAVSANASTLQINATGANLTTFGGAVTGTSNLTTKADAAGGITFAGLMNIAGTITNSGVGAGVVTLGGGTGSNVTGITESSETSALALSGSIAVNVSGTTLTNANTAGALLLTVSGGVTGTGNLVLNNNSDIAGGITLSTTAVNNTGTITSSGSGLGTVVISAPVGANVTGITQNSATSFLTLSGINTPYAGTTSLTLGTLRLGSATALGGNGSPTGNGGALVIAGGTTLDATVATTITTTNAKTVNGNFTFGGTFALNLGPGTVTGIPASLQISNAGANLATFGGALSGTTNLTTKAEAAGGITITGLVNVAGTVVNSGIGAGIVTLSGGVGSNVTGVTENSTTSALVVSGGLVVNATTTTLINANASGAATMTFSGGVTGTGNLVLNNNSAIAGGITLSTVSVNHSGTVTSSGSGTGSVVISSGVGSNVTTLTMNTVASALTISGAISVNGVGKTLTNANLGTNAIFTVTGGFTGTGNLVLRNNTDLANGVTVSTADVNNTGSVTNNGTGAGNVLISAAVGANVTAVTQNSTTSSLNLTGTNTPYAGTTTLSAGTLRLGSATALGGNGSPTGTGGSLVIAGGTTLDATAATTLTTTNAKTINGNFTFGGAFALNVGSGTVSIVPSTLQINTGSGTTALTTIGGTVTGTTNLTVNVAGSTGITFAGPVNISGTITNAGTGLGTVTFSGGTGSNVTAVIHNSTTSPTTFSGNLAVNAGGTTLTNTFGAAFPLTLSGGVTGTGNLILQNNSDFVNGITLSGSAVNHTGSITNAGSGAGSTLISASIGANVTGITQNSSTSFLSISGTNTAFAGSTTLSLGTLRLGSATALGGNGSTTGTGGTLTIGAGTTLDASAATTITTTNAKTINGDFTFGGAFALNIGPGAVTVVPATLQVNTNTGTTTLATIGGPISGTTNLTVNVAGTVGVTFAGLVNIAGTVSNIGTGAGIATFSGGLGSNVTTVTQNSVTSPLTVSGNIAVNSSGTSITNAVTGTAAVITVSGGATGTGNLLLANNSDVAGGITVSTVSVNNAGTITSSGTGLGSVVFSAPIGSNVTTVTLNSLSSAFTLSGLVTVNASGTTFRNINSLTGVALTLSGGVTGTGNLILRNNTDMANGLTVSTGTVNNIGTITNTGTGAGNTLLSAAVGANVTGVTQNSSTSPLTLSGTNTPYAGTTTLTSGTLRLGSATALGGNGSPIGTGGTLVIAGGTTLDASAATTLTTTNAKTINGDFTFGGSFALNLGPGAVTVTPSSLQINTNFGTTTLATIGGAITGTTNITINVPGTVGITFAGLVNTTGTISNTGAGVGTTTFSGGLGSNIVSVTQNSATAPLTVSGNLAVRSPSTTVTNAITGTSAVLTLSGGANGTGNLILANNSSTTGGISVTTTSINNAGTVTSSGTGIGSVVFSAPLGSNVTAVTLNSLASALTLSGPISVNASGTTFTNANALTGVILTLTGGATGTGNIVLRNNTPLANGITLSGTEINVAGTLTNNGTGDGNTLVTAAVGTNVTGVTQNSSTSPLTLAGINTPYAGTTTVTAGALRLGSATALGGNGSPTGTGGALQIAAGTTIDASVATTLTTTNAKTINGNFAFGGSFTLNLGPGSLTIVPSSLQITNLGAATSTLSGNISGTTNLTTKADAAGGLVFSGLVNNTGTLVNSGAGTGTVTFSGGMGPNITGITQSSITSPLSITGSLAVNSSGTTVTNIQGGASVLTLSGGTSGTGNLTLLNNSDIANGITLSTITVNHAGAILNAGTGAGNSLVSAPVGANVTAVTQNSATSPLTLSGVNTPYGGTTTLSNGTLRLGSATALGGNGNATGTGGALIIGAGTILDATVATTLTTTNAKTVNGNFTFGGSFALNIGPGTVTVTPGALVITNAGAVATIGGSVLGTTNLTTSTTTAGGLVFTGLVNTLGSLTNAGTGTGAATFSGGIGSNVTSLLENSTTSGLVISGLLNVNASGTTLTNNPGGATLITVSGGTAGTGNLILQNNAITANGITLSTTSINHTGTLVNAGTGTGIALVSADIGANVTSITQNSATSILVLSGVNTAYAGTTSLNAGTLRVGSATALGGNGSTTGTGGALILAAGTTFDASAATTLTTTNATTLNGDFVYGGTAALTTGPGTITVVSPTTLIQASNGNALTLGGTLTGTTNLTLNANGGGSITVNGPINISGTVTASGTGAGSVNLAGGAGSGVTSLIANSITSALNVSGALAMNANGTSLVNTLGTRIMTVSGGISGTGNLTLSNNSDLVGGITISTANVNNVGSINNLGTGVGSVIISAPVGANVTGINQNSAASRLVLSGTNSAYGGNTALNVGTLILSSATALGGNGSTTGTGGALNIANGATLDAGAATTLTTVNAINVDGDMTWGGSFALTTGTGAVNILAPATQLATASGTTRLLTIGGPVGGTTALSIKVNGSVGITFTGLVNIAGSITNSGTGAGVTTFTGGLGSNVMALVENSTQSAMTVTGATVTPNSGNLALTNSNTGGFAALTLSGGITGTGGIALYNHSSISGGIVLSSGTVNNAGVISNLGTGTGSVTITAPLGSAVTGVLQNSATSAFVLTGSSASSGPVTMQAGILNVNSSGALGNASATNTLSFTGGTLQAAGTLTSPSTRPVTLGANAFIDGNGNSVTLAGTISGSGGLTKSGAGTLFLTGATSIGGNLTLTAGSLSAPASSLMEVKGNWINNASFIDNGGTVTLNGATSQSIGGSSTTTFNNLTLNNGAGATIAKSPVITGTLALTDGRIAAGSNKVTLAATGTITGAGATRYVTGNLERFVANSASPSVTFNIGDSTYRPVTVAFTGTTSGSGSMTASTSSTEDLANPGSAIGTAEDVKGYWTIANNGIGGFSSATSTFGWPSGDADAGASTSGFAVRRFDGSSWTSPAPDNQSATSIRASGLTSFGSFKVGLIPGFAGVAPGSYGQGATSKNITVTGSGFKNGAVASFSGTGITVNSTNFNTANSLTVNVTIANSATVSGRDLTITNTDGATMFAAGAFTVAIGPTFSSVAPSSWGPGTVNKNLAVTGANFVNGAVTSISGADITVNSTTVNSATSLTVNVSIGASAVASARNITIANPDGGTVTAPSAFTVTAPPVFATIVPATKGQGLSNQSLAVTGSGFATGASAAFSGTGITVNSTTVNSATSLTLNISTAAGATASVRNLTITNLDGGAVTAVGAFAILDTAPTALTYTTNPVTYIRNSTIAANNPLITGGKAALVYTIESGALPTGLVLNSNGTVTGTPTGMGSFAPVIRATNTGGFAQATLTITVMDTVPVISYATKVFTFGVTIDTLAPQSTAGGVTAYALVDALPAGLALNTSNGKITGTPTIASVQKSYRIRATGPGGIDTTTATITVNPVAAGAPTNVVGTSGNSQVTVSWSAPSFTGGTTLSSYLVTAVPGGATCATPNGTVTQCIVTGLTNGTSYTFTATAVNAAGNSPASVASAAVIPRTVPTAPLAVTATPGNTLVSVSWTAPLSNGGAAITAYTVSASPGGGGCVTTGGSNTQCVITGLTNGSTYTFTVTATNEVGTGLASESSAPATPRTIPGAPTGVTGVAGNAQIIVSWVTPTTNGGAAITGYTATAAPGGATCSIAGSNAAPCVIVGLANGSSYTITVTASNVAGTSPASDPSSPITPVAPPEISYISPLALVKGVFASATVTSTGGPVASYIVSPALPFGLTLNSLSGTLSGSPLFASPLTNYTVIATNVGGSDTALIAISIQDFTPVIAFQPAIDSFFVDSLVSKVPVSTGGPIESWSISPILPEGLGFNTNTGAITGTPTVASGFTNYIVIATGPYGADTTFLTLMVRSTVSLRPSAFAFRVTGQEKPYTFVVPAGASVGQLTMQIIDITGRVIWAKSMRPTGVSHNALEIAWDSKTSSGRVASAGVYIVRVTVINDGRATDYLQRSVTLKTR